MSEIIPGVTSGTNSPEAAAQAQAEGTSPEAVTSKATGDVYSQSVSTMGELRERFPDIYKGMEKVIIRNILSDIKSFQERIKKARKEAER